MNPEPFHYIWSGPPASGKYKGQDTIWPELLAQRCPDLPISFGV